MQLVKAVTVQEIEVMLTKHNSNIRLHNYGMPDCCPENELECFKVKFEQNDLGRLYLVGNFANVTAGTCKLSLLDAHAVQNQIAEGRSDRIRSFMSGGDEFQEGIDLLQADGFEPVLVGPNLENGKLLFIDGSHRAIAHFICHGNLNEVRAYACIHPNFKKYSLYRHVAHFQ